MLEINKIHCGDCLELMKEIPDESIDLILCDLPYGITQNTWDSELNLELLWIQYKRIIKINGSILLTASQPFSSKLVTSNIKMFKHEWIWEKDGGSNFGNTSREPMKEHEHILLFSNGKWTFNRIMEERTGSRKGKDTISMRPNKQSECYGKFKNQGVWNVPKLRVPRSIQRFVRERGLHPTQKPISLFEYLIKTYTNEGDLVLDNCIGSGTTAVACKQLGRNFIGIELNPTYVEIANRRLEQTRLSIPPQAKASGILEATL